MKLWQKKYALDKEIEKFTVGNDFELDLKLVPFDCDASLAHAKMLHKTKIMSKKELQQLQKGLQEIKTLHAKNQFKIKIEDEDCHTAIENYMTKKYGTIGQKMHTARSRNEVLVAMRLYEKHEIKEIKVLLLEFKKVIAQTAKKYQNIQIPGYTHMQKAMPTTVQIWLHCFSDSMDDNLELLEKVYEIIDQNPLGTGAGFGIPVLKIDRKMTTALLGFSKVLENPIYAQMSRGKFESSLVHVLSQILFDLNKLATDLMLFSMSEFGYVGLPTELCTGSSIMPQKKNPDVLELVRAKYHIVLGEEFKLKSLIANLMSGYNRDVQLTKEPVMKSIETTKSCIKIMTLVISKIEINEEKCKKAMTKELFATQEAYKLVKKGMPFREAYQEIGKRYSK